VSGAIDDLVAAADQALVVFTTAAGDQRSGCLVGFHTQCSIEPFQYAVWISKANRTYRLVPFASHFAVHFLRPGDEQVAELFGAETGDDIDKFARCSWTEAAGGVPLLAGMPAAVFERRSLFEEEGDHICIVGEPVRVEPQDFTPMRLSAAEHLEPGHQSGERQSPDEAEAEADEPVDDLQEIAAGFGHELTPEQGRTEDQRGGSLR